MYFKVPTYRNKTAGNVLQEGNVVRCVRVLDERTASGQRRQAVVLTLNRWANGLPAHALEILTPEEQEQWAAWKAEHDQAHQLKEAEQALRGIARSLALATLALNAGIKAANAKALWTSVDTFTSALSQTGQPRPKRSRGRPAHKKDSE